jgi:hypothetical protein
VPWEPTDGLIISRIEDKKSLFVKTGNREAVE